VPATLFPNIQPSAERDSPADPLIKKHAPAAEDTAPVAQPEPIRPGAH